MRNNLITLLLIGTISTVFAGCSLLGKQRVEETPEPSTEPEVVETSPTPNSSPTSEQVEVQDEVKDGVYTNYTYGFRFEYDDEKFVTKDDFPNANFPPSFFYSEENQRIDLNLTIREPQEGVYTGGNNFYEELYNTDIGVTTKSGDQFYTKLADKKYSNEIKRVDYYQKTSEDSERQKFVTYHSVLIYENDLSIDISMFTNPRLEEFLKQNKYLFDQIVESIEFID